MFSCAKDDLWLRMTTEITQLDLQVYESEADREKSSLDYSNARIHC